MRKPSYADLEVRYRNAESALGLCQVALQCVHHETAHAYAKYGSPHGKYEYAIYRADAPHGGILLVTFSRFGQKPHTRPYYWEEYLQSVSGFSGDRAVVGKLREQLFDRERREKAKEPTKGDENRCPSCHTGKLRPPVLDNNLWICDECSWTVERTGGEPR